MPWSVFLDGHIAVHGTDQVRWLGRRASHGCVRLHPEHAKLLFDMVREVGRANTVIIVHP